MCSQRKADNSYFTPLKGHLPKKTTRNVQLGPRIVGKIVNIFVRIRKIPESQNLAIFSIDLWGKSL
jgi:hypothetical protein